MKYKVIQMRKQIFISKSTWEAHPPQTSMHHHLISKLKKDFIQECLLKRAMTLNDTLYHRVREDPLQPDRKILDLYVEAMVEDGPGVG